MAMKCVLPMLFADMRRFCQVMTNIIRNAIRCTKRGWIQINVRYDSENKALVAIVRDTGCGIMKDELPHIFSKFGKLARSAEMNSDVNGIGLHISKLIVEQNNGEITAESNGRDLGSVF